MNRKRTKLNNHNDTRLPTPPKSPVRKEHTHHFNQPQISINGKRKASLPLEIILHTLTYLDPFQLWIIRCISRQFMSLAELSLTQYLIKSGCEIHLLPLHNGDPIRLKCTSSSGSGSSLHFTFHPVPNSNLSFEYKIIPGPDPVPWLYIKSCRYVPPPSHRTIFSECIPFIFEPMLDFQLSHGGDILLHHRQCPDGTTLTTRFSSQLHYHIEKTPIVDDFHEISMIQRANIKGNIIKMIISPTYLLKLIRRLKGLPYGHLEPLPLPGIHNGMIHRMNILKAHGRNVGLERITLKWLNGDSPHWKSRKRSPCPLRRKLIQCGIVPEPIPNINSISWCWTDPETQVMKSLMEWFSKAWNTIPIDNNEMLIIPDSKRPSTYAEMVAQAIQNLNYYTDQGEFRKRVRHYIHLRWNLKGNADRWITQTLNSFMASSPPPAPSVSYPSLMDFNSVLNPKKKRKKD